MTPSPVQSTPSPTPVFCAPASGRKPRRPTAAPRRRLHGHLASVTPQRIRVAGEWMTLSPGQSVPRAGVGQPVEVTATGQTVQRIILKPRLTEPYLSGGHAR